jgi:hypothetical protein
MLRKFPGDKTSIGLIEEVVALVYVGDDLDNLTSAIKWAGQQERALQSHP